MPFPLDEKFVVEAESQLEARLPEDYRQMMIEENGGRVALGGDEFWLHPIRDISDRKRLKRTCNHLLLETANRKDFGGFPEIGLEIGANSSGDAILLLSEGSHFLEEVHFFDHETHETSKTKWSVAELKAKRETS